MPTASQPNLTPVQGAHLKIEKVLFTSSKEATQLMNGEDPGLPGDAQVCFVLLNGPFHVHVDRAPGIPESDSAIATEIGVVFDAHTGNLLEWAILDSFPGSSPAQASPTHANAQPAAQSIARYSRSLPVQSTSPSISYSCNSLCWGTNYWPNQVNGAFTGLSWNYPYATLFGHGDGNTFVQNVMWLIDENEPSNCRPFPNDLPGDCWVEAGLRAYNNGGSNATVLFWGDVGPGHGYADHYGAEVNTLYSTCCVDMQIWKAGTVSGIGWCPTAASEWCVDIYSETDYQEMTGISGAGHSNTMTVSSYREGMELYGTSGAVANEMHFTYNLYEDVSTNNWYYQNVKDDITKYVDNPPVESYWPTEPGTFAAFGGMWLTCISGSGC